MAGLALRYNCVIEARDAERMRCVCAVLYIYSTCKRASANEQGAKQCLSSAEACARPRL